MWNAALARLRLMNHQHSAQGFVCVTLAVVAALWAVQIADRTAPSWDTECYSQNACDSLTFTTVAELLAEGRTPYVAQTRREHISTTRLAGEPVPFDLPFQYPPNALPLFAVRALASPRAATLSIIFITTVTCLLLFWRLAWRRLTDGPTTVLLTCGVAFSSIVALDARVGQTGLLAATLVLGTTLGWTRWPVAACTLLGVLAFKPQYALPLLLVALAHRNWRIVAGAVGGFAVLTSISAALFGVDEWLGFFSAVNEPNHTGRLMANWVGLAWRAAPEASELIQAAAIPAYLLAVVGLAVGLAMMRDRTSIEGQLSVVTAWMVLVSPNTHAYDLLVLSPALVYISRGAWGACVGPLFFLLSWVAISSPSRWILILGLGALALLCTRFLGRETHHQDRWLCSVTSQ